jgi:hypothetical protein
LDHRLYTEAEIAALPVPEHLRRMGDTAWRLGGRRHLAGLQLRRWAHMLGFRGHFATRNRRSSTTLTALRAARADFQRRLRDRPHPGPEADVDPWGGSTDTATIEVVGRWRYAGTGYRTPVHRRMAADLIDRHHETQEAIRLLRRLQRTGQLPIQAA